MGSEEFLSFTASQWTAIGTVALSVITIVYVIVTGQMAGHSKRAAEAAERDLLASTAVLVRASPRGGGHSAAGTRYKVELENVSRNPALNVGVLVVVEDESGNQTSFQTWVHVQAPGRSGLIELLEPGSDGPWPVHIWYFSVTAEDMAGNSYMLHSESQPEMGDRIVVTKLIRTRADGSTEVLLPRTKARS